MSIPTILLSDDSVRGDAAWVQVDPSYEKPRYAITLRVSHPERRRRLFAGNDGLYGADWDFSSDGRTYRGRTVTDHEEGEEEALLAYLGRVVRVFGVPVYTREHALVGSLIPVPERGLFRDAEMWEHGT